MDDTVSLEAAQASRQGAASDEAPAMDDTVSSEIAARVHETLFGSAASAGVRMGRFVLLEQLGAGGMGAVHAAYDEELDRKVAIKVLRDDHEGDGTLRDRLQREAQAMARLSHPNVATVHEVGYSQGTVFVAMEFIRGQDLGDWLSTEPPWPEVLEAFAQAGRGLQAAHEADLVHRDFKPQNAMRTEGGVVKVLDFGLAHMAGDPSSTMSSVGLVSGSSLTSTLTAAGTVMGTPAYMAPEQHRGDPTDARTDQYAFCIALWRGLAGRRPFEGSTLRDLFEAKLRGPPPWPDGVRLPPKPVLDALRRGLSPEPGERFPSMGPLLEALRWDPGRRRRRWMLGAVGVGVVALGGMVAKGSAETRAQRCEGARAKLDGVWDESRREAARASILGVDRHYAAGVWTRAEQALDGYADAWVEMHTEACEATAVRGEQSAAMLDLRMRCLHRASVDLEATVATLSDADVDVLDGASELVASLRPLSRCADTEALEAEVEPPLPREADAVEQARKRLARAASERGAGRSSAARVQVDAAAELLADVEYGPANVELASERGLVLHELGDYDAAEAMFLEALEQAAREGLRREVTRSSRHLMHVVGVKQQRMDEALRYWPFVAGFSVDDLDTADSRHTRGLIFSNQGRYAEAEVEYRAALRLKEKSLGPDHLDANALRDSLGGVLNSQGRYEEAETELRAVVRAWVKALGPDHPKVGGSRSTLGIVLVRRGRYEEAEAEFRESLRVKQAALGRDHPTVADSVDNLGGLLAMQGRYEEAEAEFREALRVKQEVLGPDHPSAASSRTNLGNVLQEQGRYEDAERAYRAALPIREKALGAEHPRIAQLRNNFGNLLWKLGRHEEAEAEFRAASSAWEKALGPDHPHVATSWDNLGHFLLHRGQYEEAEAKLRAALGARDKALDPGHVHVAQSRIHLAELLLETRRLDEAHEQAEDAWTHLRETDTESHVRAKAAFVLARILWSVGPPARDRERARTLAEDAATAYGAGVDEPTKKLAEVTRWLEEHRVR